MIKQALTMRMVGLIDHVIPLRSVNRPAAVADINQPRTMGPTTTQPGANVLDAEQQQKAQAALNTLCGIDPKLGDHLAAIARIAISDPNQYNWLVVSCEMITDKIFNYGKT